MVKRVSKLAISILFFTLRELTRRISLLAGMRPSGTWSVLYYHAVEDSQKQKFERQMARLPELACPLHSDHEGQLDSGHYASVTFDDGLVCVAENALPAMLKHNIPVTVFVPTAAIGRRPGWTKTYSSTDKGMVVMSAEQLQRIQNGLVQIGAHTVSHPRLASLSEKEALNELTESKQVLEEILGRPVTQFAFPYGDFDAKSVELCRRVGYRRVFTITPRDARPGNEGFVTGRVAADPEDWPIEFRLKVRGGYNWLVWARALRRKFRPNARERKRNEQRAWS